MRGIRWRSICVLAVAISVAGCQTAGTKRPSTIVSPAPAVGEAVNPGDTVAEKAIAPAPVKTVTFVDRHPLFFKPREYWENSGDKKIVKAAAATFIGVPVGFVGEVKQIIVGAPAEARY